MIYCHILKIISVLSIILCIMFFSLSFSILWKYSPELPGYNKILEYKPDLSSRLYTSDGKLLKSYHRQERVFIPIERIPKDLIHAFISSEDKKFYSHYGIDLIAIIRASLTNILSFLNKEKGGIFIKSLI